MRDSNLICRDDMRRPSSPVRGLGAQNVYRFEVNLGLPTQLGSPAPVPENKFERQIPRSSKVKSGLAPRILLVEDSKDNQLLVTAYLKKTDYQVETADNGRAGVEKFISGDFDLVLMDIQMPEMDGYAATTGMREWESQHGKPPIPILALTVHATANDFQRSRAAGCDAHLTKPIRQDTLLRAVQEHLTSWGAIRIHPPKEVEELVPGYLRNRRADLLTLRVALKRHDYDAIRVLGHNMKGSGAGYGFPPIGAIGKRLEIAAKAESTREIETEISALTNYLNQFDVIQ